MTWENSKVVSDMLQIKTKKSLNFKEKKYPVTIYNDCVQTLINDRILYRIYLVEEKEIGHNLASIVNF